MENKVANIRIT